MMRLLSAGFTMSPPLACSCVLDEVNSVLALDAEDCRALLGLFGAWM